MDFFNSESMKDMLPIIIIASIAYFFIRSRLKKAKNKNTTAPNTYSARPYESSSTYETESDEKKKTCQGCGKLTFEEYKFCPYCGSNKFKTSEPKPQRAKKAADKVDRSNDTWVCGGCGTTNELALDNCKNCGKEFWPEL